MSISKTLDERCQGTCELCNNAPATAEYTVSPRKDDAIVNQVALCDTCLTAIDTKGNGAYWSFLEGSIWNPEPSIQALSYRILQSYKDEDWANDIISSVELDENTVQWAMSAFEVADVHKDVFGNILENGDNVVLTQALDVKGTSFSAPKGTVVKKIRLVQDNTGQIEGKINDQTIVILTKYVKKG
ncbi:PhnA protein [Terrimonas sp.]|uniref:PhnA domain-containing protein n=1 Tax=Terrimonas sp. TaxID=1914338 RepID=UPI000D51588F|nr:alkylphosphonate utilization protein [Terrimonas sp.]PVD50338.1 PhnA protein [Terrimonas sp.]